MDICKLIQTESLDVINARASKKGFTTSSKWFDYAALNSALKCGRKDVVQLLLHKNCRLNREDQSSIDTPLHNALHLVDPVLISDLLERKASLVALNANGDSPLHLAFLHKQEKLVDVMLDFIEKNSIYSNPKNIEGLTHLHIACTRNNAKAIEGFLRNKAAIEDITNSVSTPWAGYNAFHFAAEFKSMTAIKVLMSQCTEESIQASTKRNSRKKTPLQLLNQHLEELSIMASLVNKTGFSPFHAACLGSDTTLLKRFLDNSLDPNRKLCSPENFCASYSPLHFAAKSKNHKSVKLLLRRKADPNCQNDDDMVPVQLALYNKTSKTNNRIVRKLYDSTKNKLELTADKNGLSLMHVACSMDDLETVEEFLDKGVDVNSRVTYERQRFYHYTPLHFAIKYERLELIKYLVGRGAEVNCSEDCVDGTPLLLACKVGHKDIIDFLLKRKANVKAVRSRDWKTPLHLLIKYYPLMMPQIARLVQLGVDVNAQDIKGNTPLHSACHVDHGLPCVRLLLENGADVNVENNSGLVAFDCQLSCSYSKSHVQPGDYTLLYHRVQELKAMGFGINPKNEACCKRLFEKQRFKWDPRSVDFEQEELARRRQQRSDEIAEMRRIRITKDVSLCDFVRMDSFDAIEHLTNDTLMENLRKEFPVYGYLLRQRFQRAFDCIGVKRRRYE